MNTQNKHDKSDWIEPREWFYSHLPAPFPFPSLKTESSNANVNFLRDLHPFSAEYYQRLIPIFSSFLTEQTEISNYDSLFLRDGIISLLHFILKHEERILKSPTRFFIHKNLSPLIPLHLQDSFCYYALKSTPLKKVEKKRLLIAGTFFNEQLSDLYVQEVIQHLKKTLPPNLTIDTYFSSGNACQNPKQIIQVHKTIEKELGPIDRQLEWKQVYFQRFLPETFAEYYFFELNPQLYYSDSFVAHYFLKKGADLIPPQEDSKGDFQLELSPWHSFELWDKLPQAGSKAELMGEHREILKMLLENKDERPVLGLPPVLYPWNSDFALYLQEMFTEEKILKDI